MMFNPFCKNPCKKCIISMVCTEECPDKMNYWTTVVKISDSLPIVSFGFIFLTYIGGYIIKNFL
jgi:hypothetical protein